MVLDDKVEALLNHKMVLVSAGEAHSGAVDTNGAWKELGAGHGSLPGPIGCQGSRPSGNRVATTGLAEGFPMISQIRSFRGLSMLLDYIV